MTSASSSSSGASATGPAGRVALDAMLDALGAVLSEDRAEKTLACRILMRLCVVDGEFHPTEAAFLETTMARHGLDGDARGAIALERAILSGDGSGAAAPQSIRDAAAQPLSALLDALPPAARGELWTHLQHGAWADGKLVPAESDFLDAVRQHFEPRRG